MERNIDSNTKNMKKFDFTTIKTFEDACLKLGIDPIKWNQEHDRLPDHITALMELEIITEAINDGWRHPLDGRTPVYYVWTWLFDDDEIKAGRPQEYPIVFKMLRPDASAGLGSANSNFAWSYSISYFGSRLAYQTREQCDYSLKQFSSLWESWLYPQEWQIEERRRQEND